MVGAIRGWNERQQISERDSETMCQDTQSTHTRFSSFGAAAFDTSELYNHNRVDTHEEAAIMVALCCGKRSGVGCGLPSRQQARAAWTCQAALWSVEYIGRKHECCDYSVSLLLHTIYITHQRLGVARVVLHSLHPTDRVECRSRPGLVFGLACLPVCLSGRNRGF